ncbi:MAG TPA: hypothetical protein VF756_08120 [Thermoanaerobaculia bacterium]
MKGHLIRAFAVLAVLALTVLAAQAAPAGWTYQGCWSPYPNCVGAKDVYTDASGSFWQCRACGTTTNPSTSTCYKSGNLNNIGYWCGVTS